jgi:hypothetical protein
LDQLVADCVADECSARGDAELSHCGRPVRLRRLAAYTQDCGRLAATFAVGDQRDDLPLARTERI